MIAYFRDVCVGAVRCQYEPPSEDAANPCEGRIYIMTLGVLAPYRRYGIGTHSTSPLYLTVLIGGVRHKITRSCSFGSGNSDAWDAWFTCKVIISTCTDNESRSSGLVHETRVHD